MKKIVSLSAAALLIAACSDTTAPNSATPTSAEIAVRQAKPSSDPGITVAGTLTNDSFSFDDGTFSSSAGTSMSIEELDGGFGASAPSFTAVYNSASNKFVGRLDNHKVNVVVPNGGGTFLTSFDLYIIGSWDGDGQQSGKAHGPDIWSVGVACSAGGAVVQNLLTTTFSNQKTVQQSYPNAWGPGGNPATRGAHAVDALGFKSDPTSHTPQFQSVGDSWYQMQFSGVNPCGAGNAIFLVFTIPNANLQSNYDESWGIDNLVVKTDA